VWWLTLVAGAVVGAPAEATVSGEAELFAIARSQNKNLVQYAVHLDAACIPMPGAPVYAYWRMLERGPTSTAPLLPYEERAYGLASQQVVSPVTAGAAGAVRIVLRAVPSRPLLVETWRAGDGTCRGLATVQIAGAPAHLTAVYVRLRSPISVDYLLLQGWSMDGTRRVEEKLGT
jgi:hypothetical protein